MTPYYTDDLTTLHHGDCRDLLPVLPPADLLLVDPPYGIPKGSAVWRRNGTAIEDWADVGHNATVEGWRELVRLQPDAWIVEFGVRAGDGFAVAAAHAALGWQPSNMYALVKSAPAPTPRPGFCNAIELAVVSRLGKPKWHGTGYVPNRWIGLTPNRKNQAEHPTQKPLEPMQALIRALCPPTGLVLDPFAGSGTTLRAAKDESRRSLGIEIERGYCDVAVKRLGQDVLDFGGAA